MIYVFCAVPVFLALVQLAAVSVLVWYVRKKVVAHANEVVEKTHVVMDAVLVSLLPQNVIAELAVPEANLKKEGESKKS